MTMVISSTFRFPYGLSFWNAPHCSWMFPYYWQWVHWFLRFAFLQRPIGLFRLLVSVSPSRFSFVYIAPHLHTTACLFAFVLRRPYVKVSAVYGHETSVNVFFARKCVRDIIDCRTWYETKQFQAGGYRPDQFVHLQVIRLR